jgi:hypothetical protein
MYGPVDKTPKAAIWASGPVLDDEDPAARCGVMVAACARQKTIWYSRNVHDPTIVVVNDRNVTLGGRHAPHHDADGSGVVVDVVVKDSYGRSCAVDAGRSKSDLSDDAAVALDSSSCDLSFGR